MHDHLNSISRWHFRWRLFLSNLHGAFAAVHCDQTSVSRSGLRNSADIGNETENSSMTDKSARIRKFNDALRRQCIPNVTTPPGPQHGTTMMTIGVQALPDETQIAVLKAVATFDSFGPDNDPFGEHDFGLLEIEGEKLFWKIDCFEKGSNFQAGAETPEDAATTDRVLTIMLAEEY